MTVDDVPGVPSPGGPDPDPPEGPPFDGFYREHWPAVVALGWTLSGSRPVGEELAQDAFLDAFRRWDHVGALDRPGAWVRRAVANRAVSHRRHLRVVEVGAGRLATEARVRQGRDDAETAAGGIDEDFWAAVRALPERQAQCVALHYLEDRGIDDIAGVLDCRASTVRVHLHRGRRALARSLGLDGAADDHPDPGGDAAASPEEGA